MRLCWSIDPITTGTTKEDILGEEHTTLILRMNSSVKLIKILSLSTTIKGCIWPILYISSYVMYVCFPDDRFVYVKAMHVCLLLQLS